MPKTEPAGVPQPTRRTWNDSSGKYSTEAIFVDFKDGGVRLREF